MTKSLVLTNSGNADLELIEVSLEGAEINSYDYAAAIQKRIAVGQSQTLPLKFQPQKAGTLSVNLRFKTTVPNQADTLVSLTGTGTQAGPPPDYWKQAWQDFQNHYSYFDHKGINWTDMYAAHTNDFVNLTPDQFAEKLNDVLQILHDWHVAVQKPDGTWIGYKGAYTRNTPLNLYDTYTGGANYADVKNAHAIYHAWVATNIAHLVIDTLATEPFNAISDADLEQLFQTYSGAAGMIIDIRNNNGGNEANAAKFAARFTNTPRIFGYYRNRITNTVPYQFGPLTAKTLQPSAGTHFRKPVVGLVGQRCMSSAEWFTLMLKACPNVILIGDRTRGASGNPILKTIPDLKVSYQISTWMAYTDQQAPFEDRGIAPDIGIPAQDSFSDALKRDYVLERAISYILWRQGWASGLVEMRATTDFDQDGLCDLDEYWAGTNPTQAQSRLGFRAGALKVQPTGGLSLQWDSVASKQYSVWRSTNLPAGFSLVESNIIATPPLNTYTDVTATGRGPYFYKVGVPKK
jgi:hypothetical protein